MRLVLNLQDRTWHVGGRESGTLGPDPAADLAWLLRAYRAIDGVFYTTGTGSAAVAALARANEVDTQRIAVAAARVRAVA